MKYLPRFLLIIILISFLNSTSIAQPETNVSEVDTLAYFPHWELIKGGKTQTTLYVTFLGPNGLGRIFRSANCSKISCLGRGHIWQKWFFIKVTQ